MEQREEEVLEVFRSGYTRGARLLSFCTGAFVLAEAGLLKRILLNLRIEREVKKRVQAAHITPGGPHAVRSP